MKKIRNIALILLIYIGIIFINTKAYATSAKTISETTRIRKEATTDSSVVELVSQNEEVTILSKEGEWYKIEYNKDGKTYSGYIREDMLKLDEETNTENSNQVENNTQNEEQQNQVSEQVENTLATQDNQENVATVDTQNGANNDQDSSESNIKEGYTAKTTQNLEIKILPIINSAVIGEIGADTQYTVKEVINKWSYIETIDKSGWVLLSKLNSSTANIKNNQAQDSNNQENTIQNDSQVTAENNAEKNNQENNQTASNKQTEEKKESTNTTEESKETEKKTKYVSAETLNVREKAESDAKIIYQLDINTKVAVLEVIDSTWDKVEVNGITGYVASKFLSDNMVEITSRSGDTSRTNQESKNQEKDEKNDEDESAKEKSENNASNSNSSSASSATGASVVEYAKKYLGCKYVSGGTSPSTGFDCSGFTSYVYKNFGITLSRTSSMQASNGTAVQRNSLKQGDLVIFNNSSNSKVGHVGIYIGDNKFIHAANPSKGVIISALSESYYSARYAGARRVIK